MFSAIAKAISHRDIHTLDQLYDCIRTAYKDEGKGIVVKELTKVTW